MAINPQQMGANHARRSVKTSSIRLSDVAARTTTDYADLIVGSGAPSGAYGRDSSATMLYFRTDASSAATAMYVTANGGTAWTAVGSSSSGGLDMDGAELILDADADTSITADTDDQIDVRIAGADDFRFAANIFRALSGSSIETDTIGETTAGSGVSIDSTLVKDGGVRIADSGVFAYGADSDILCTHSTDSVRVTNAASGTVGYDDDVLNICDPADPTKRVRIDAGTVSAGQTRVLAMPDADVTISAAAATILDDATVGDIRTTLGVGTADSPTFAGLTTGTGQILSDYLVRAAIAVGDATGGSTDAALTVDLFRLDGTTVLGGAKQIMILAVGTQYEPFVALEASVTFSTATKGSIVASGTGWCLAETDADGEFDCTAVNSADETVYFSVCSPPAGQSDSTKGCLVVASNSDAAAWSA